MRTVTHIWVVVIPANANERNANERNAIAIAIANTNERNVNANGGVIAKIYDERFINVYLRIF